MPKLSMEKVITDINLKFEKAIGIRYEREDIVKALKHNLKWDIEIGDTKHLYDLQNEIDEFQRLLKDAMEKEEVFDFSYESRIIKRAKFFDLEVESYLELMDILEDNAFWVEEVGR